MELKDLTQDDLEALREARRNEVGTEPPCQWCEKPRVNRSDYIRCNKCGVNWLLEEMGMTYKGKPYFEVDPRLARTEAARMASTTQPTAGQ